MNKAIALLLLLISTSTLGQGGCKRMYFHMNYSLIVLLAVLFAGSALGADLAKARVLKTNGLLDEAKRELVDVAFSATAGPEDKAEALLLLGDIAAEQGDVTAAKENWTLASAVASEAPAAGIASDRLRGLAERAASAAPIAATPIAADSVLVIPDQKHPWAAPQLAAVFGSPTVLFDGKHPGCIWRRKEANIYCGSIGDLARD